jgi:DNA-binding transcriptional MerR regulator
MKLSIGEAARASACPASTIRYYERIGLLQAAQRGANGYRYYDAIALERMKFVHRARMLGFSIDEITALLRLADHPHEPCDGIDQLLATHIDAVRRKLQQLSELESELLTLQNACDGGHEIRDCGVLATLADTN